MRDELSERKQTIIYKRPVLEPAETWEFEGNYTKSDSVATFGRWVKWFFVRNMLDLMILPPVTFSSMSHRVRKMPLTPFSWLEASDTGYWYRISSCSQTHTHISCWSAALCDNKSYKIMKYVLLALKRWSSLNYGGLRRMNRWTTRGLCWNPATLVWFQCSQPHPRSGVNKNV